MSETPAKDTKPARSRHKAAPAAPAPADPATEIRKCAGNCGEVKPLRSYPTTGKVVDGVMQRGGECRRCRDSRLAARKGAQGS